MENKQVFDEIKDIIKENGDVKTEVKNKLMLLALTELHAGIQDVKTELKDKDTALAAQVEQNAKDIVELKRNSLVLWIKEHRAVALYLVLLVMVLWKTLFPLLHLVLLTVGVPDEILTFLFS